MIVLSVQSLWSASVLARMDSLLVIPSVVVSGGCCSGSGGCDAVEGCSCLSDEGRVVSDWRSFSMLDTSMLMSVDGA